MLNCSLELEVSKAERFPWSGQLPPQAPAVWPARWWTAGGSLGGSSMDAQWGQMPCA